MGTADAEVTQGTRARLITVPLYRQVTKKLQVWSTILRGKTTAKVRERDWERERETSQTS